MVATDSSTESPSLVSQLEFFGEAQPAVRTRRWRGGRAGALAASVALHVLMLAAAFASATGAIVSGGSASAGGGDAVVIHLVGRAKSKGATDDAASDAARLAALFKDVRVDEAEVQIQAPSLTSKQSVAELFAELQRGAEARARGSTEPVGERPKSSGDSQLQSTATANNKLAVDGGATADTVSTGALWGQIEPCWRKLPNASTVPVTLAVTLNAQGRIDVPPRIIRPKRGEPSEGRLTSEARALAALAACVPYRGNALFAERTRHQIEFGVTR